MSKGNIFIVEDEELIALTIRRMLAKFGYVICGYASSGEEAIATIEELKPDLVLMDISLGGTLDGVETAQQIRARRDIPVVYLTAYSDDNTIQRAKITEPFGYLLKPFNQQELIRTIDIALYNHQINHRLKEAHERLKNLEHIINHSPAVAIRWEDKENWPVNFISDNILQFGYTPNDFYSGVLNFIQIIHPDDIKLIQAEIEKNKQQQFTSFRLEYRLITYNKEIRWISDNISYMVDENNQPCYQGIMLDITMRKMTELALIDSERKYRNTIDAIDDVIHVIDKTYHLVLTNKSFDKAYATLFHSDFDRKKTIFELFQFLPESEKQKYDELMQTQKPSITEENFVMSGQELIEEVRMTPIFDADGNICQILTIARDITERKKMEETIRQSEAQHRELIEALPDAIFVEQDQQVVFINSVGLNLLKLDSQKRSSNQCLCDILSINKQTKQEIKDHLASNKIATLFEHQFLRHDQVIIVIEGVILKTMFQSRPAFLGVFRDITETKALIQKAQRMENLAALGQFSATIAHEIRNPLASISMNFEYLANKLNIKDKDHETYQDVKDGIERIQHIIKDVLDYARPKDPVKVKTNVHEVLDQSIHSVENALESGNVLLIREYADNIPELMIDRHQMIQVFVNLMMNAKRAMPAGGYLIIRTFKTDEQTCIAIDDTGEGITSENLSKIFTPFFTTRTDGTGLGLAVVSQIVEQHNARIIAESDGQNGSSFKIFLPNPELGTITQ